MREVVLWAERKREQHNRDMTVAWQTANLTRAKKLPPLRDLLVRPPTEQRQSKTELLAMLHKLSAKYGGKVRRIGG